MCAMDRRERALISQLHFPHSLGEAISFLKYPVCVRFEDGSFIQENNRFEKLIRSSFNSCDEWFDSLNRSRLNNPCHVLVRAVVHSVPPSYRISFL